MLTQILGPEGRKNLAHSEAVGIACLFISSPVRGDTSVFLIPRRVPPRTMIKQLFAEEEIRASWSFV